MGIKVVVGQVWEYDGNKDQRYTINAIDNNGRHCRAYCADGSDCSFGNLDEQGCITGLVSTSDWKVISDVQPIVSAASTIATIAVNDYTCPTCHNTRCSKSEGKCWSCGNNL